MDDWGPAEQEAVEWDDIAGRVGWVAINSARLELSAAWLFTVLLRSALAPTVAAGQNWSTVEQSCRALISKHEAVAADEADERWQLPRFAAMRSDLARASDLMKARAAVVHGYWLAAQGPGELPTTARQRRFKPVERRSWSGEELDQLSADLKHVSGAISQHAAWFKHLHYDWPDQD